MPAYLGVKKAELIRSINDALELLETHSIGPECQQRIDKLRKVNPATGSSPLGAIAAATDDAALAEAVSTSGATWIFSRLYKVLEFHAAQNTGGNAAAIVRHLDKWDARDCIMTMEYNRVDEESDVWLSFQKLKNASMGDPASQSRVQKIFDELMMQGEETVAIKVVNLVASLAGAKTDMQQWENVFLELDLRERHVARQFIDAMAAPAVQKPRPKAESPFSRYGIAVDDLNGRMNGQDPELQLLSDRVDQALKPFMATHEVQMVGLGIISDDLKNNPCAGVMFMSTARAAQAVANALPDQLIIDGKGRIIPPKTRRQPPKPGIKP